MPLLIQAELSKAQEATVNAEKVYECCPAAYQNFEELTPYSVAGVCRENRCA